MGQKDIDLLRHILKNSLQVVDFKVLYTFLMPDEEHLGGFSQMGFHVNFWHVGMSSWLNMLSYNISCTLFVIFDEFAASHNCASC